MEITLSDRSSRYTERVTVDLAIAGAPTIPASRWHTKPWEITRVYTAWTRDNPGAPWETGTIHVYGLPVLKSGSLGKQTVHVYLYDAISNDDVVPADVVAGIRSAVAALTPDQEVCYGTSV